MEDTVVNHPPAKLSIVVPACLALLVGCSSRAIETSMPARQPARQPIATAAPSGGRPSGPIPEVIAKAKPFRVSEMSELVASGAAPAHIMQTSATAPATTGGPDVSGISRMMRSYLQAFNRHDSEALATHWSDTGENVDLDTGETIAGREAVRDVFAALFEQDAGAMIDIDIASIRRLRDDVAVVDGVSRISFTGAAPSNSRFSAVVVREAGNWVLDTVRESNGLVQNAGVEPLQRADPKPLDELTWLLGSWEDVSDGVTASTQCVWSPNNAFLIRRHAVSADAGMAQRSQPGDSRIPGLLPAGSAGRREITEIIGWDPDREQIRSWVFTSEGQFAEGSWSREGDAWTVRLESGAAAETVAASAGDCLYTLTRMGPDELAGRSSSDRLADIMPPACDFLRTARATDTAAPELP